MHHISNLRSQKLSRIYQ